MRLGSRKLKLSSTVVLAGTLALLIAGCGSSKTPTNTGPTNLASSQVMHMIWDGGGSPDIAAIDPAQAADSGSVPIVDLVFDGLVTLDKNLNTEFWGATSVDISPDGKTYTFHVRPGQKFSDGTPVKPSDYAWSMDRTLNPCVASPVNYYLWAINDAQTFSNETCDPKTNNITAGSGQTTPVLTTLVGTDIVADDSANTLTVKLAQPAGYFLEAMTYNSSFALEKSIVQGDGFLGADDKWIDKMASGSPTGMGGSGMFYISKWDHAGNLILKANPNWWGRNAGKTPHITEIDYKIFSSTDTAYSTYQSDNTYEYSGGVPTPKVASAQSQPDFHKSPLLLVQTVAFNWHIAPFDNLDARQAFCLALNRDQLNSSVLKGIDTPSWHLVPDGMPGYNKNLTGIDGVTSTTGDQAKAASHWSAYTATLNGAAIPAIKYSYNQSSTTAAALAQALVGQWNQVLPKANVTLDSTDWKTVLKLEQSKKVQMVRFGWLADYPDPQDFLTLLYSTTSSYNEWYASVPDADSKMQQADQLTGASNQAQRMGLYNAAEQELVNQVAVCPLYQGPDIYQVRTYVNGYQEDAQGNNPLDNWVKMYIQSH